MSRLRHVPFEKVKCNPSGVWCLIVSYPSSMSMGVVRGVRSSAASSWAVSVCECVFSLLSVEGDAGYLHNRKECVSWGLLHWSRQDTEYVLTSTERLQREREPERTLYISAKAILAKMEFDIKAKNQHEIAFTTVILVVVCVNIFNYI